ncbi:MAG: hypothetical protein KDK26_17295 [Roseivivax sp.]|nr:hypothetical protein [Roseivivax sp.]
MAKKDKPKASPDKPAETGPDSVNPNDIQDAVIIDLAPGEQNQATEMQDKTPEPSVETAESPAAPAGEPLYEPEPEPARPAFQPEPERAQTPPPVAAERIVERRAGFVPMLLGGVAAAALGFGVSQYLGQAGKADEDAFRAEMRSALADQAARLGTVDDRLGQAEGAVAAIDLAPLSGALDSQGGQLQGLSGTLDTVSGQLATLDERLTALEKRPVTESVSPEAIAAYERELQNLREAVATQRAEIEAIAADALESQSAAEEQAALAKARAALAEVIAAVDTGTEFAQPLELLSDAGTQPAEALDAVAGQGVPTQAALVETFPDAARQALAAARAEAPAADDGGGGIGAFLKSQFGVRSLSPRDGTDPDAVLSRAEAAVKDADLQKALDEIATLSPSAQAAMADWVAQAKARHQALSALDALKTELNKE